MIARVWFRKSGADDGLWWHADIDGSEWFCSEVEFRVPTRTSWEKRDDRPRLEQRHFIEAWIDGFHWDGARLVLTGAGCGAHNE